jgi:chemotaxis protein methyltransferase CheR
VNREVLDSLRALIHRESGIHLPPEKEQLLLNRLRKRLQALQITDTKKYLEIIEVDASGEELRRLLDVISTNVTHFYREGQHFKIFGDALESWVARDDREIKVWSAACSSGEEPYTLAMVGLEHIQKRSDIKILATDISERVLQHALQCRYHAAQLDKLPPEFVSKYFTRVDRSDDEFWEIQPQVSQLVTFKRLNLSKFPYPLKGPLHCIFCRNVMIYFKRDLRQQIINEFQRLLMPGGYLFISHSENLLGISHALESVATAVYRKTGGR